MLVVASTITQESSSHNSCGSGKTMGRNNSQLPLNKKYTTAVLQKYDFFPQKKAHR